MSINDDDLGLDLSQVPIQKHQGTEALGLSNLLHTINDPLREPIEGRRAGSLSVQRAPAEPSFNENNIDTAVIPKVLGTPRAPQKPAAPVATLAKVLLPETPPPRTSVPTRIFFTGQLGVGKDFLAAAVGADIYGFADPIYVLVSHLFGIAVSNDPASKAIPGVRESLQRLGQYGRGIVNAQYPWTPERALIVSQIRRIGPDISPLIDWSTFGNDEDIWLDACLKRVVAANPSLAAITNVRFENEFRRLTSEGWTGYHVMCSDATLKKRRPELTSQAQNDISEQLALRLNATALASGRQPGKRLRVIWNDGSAPPSPRFMTTNYFQAIFGTKP